MGSLIFSILIHTFFLRAEEVLVAGQKVQAQDIQTRDFQGKFIIHSLHLTAPTSFALARGNSIAFSTELVLHNNGRIWMARSEEKMPLISWKSKNGSTLLFHCGHPPTMNDQPTPVRYLVFDAQGELRSGCRLAQEHRLKTDQGSEITVPAFVNVDLSSEGGLSYAARIKSGEVWVGNQKLILEPQSELDFHDNGTPNFFKMTLGQAFIADGGRLGPLKVVQAEKSIYTQLNPKGQLESGILGQDLVIGSTTIPAGSGLKFEKLETSPSKDQDLREFTVALVGEQVQMADGQKIWVSQIHWDGNNDITGLVASKPFEFQTPEGQVLSLPRGSRLVLTPQGQVKQIDVPAGGS